MKAAQYLRLATYLWVFSLFLTACSAPAPVSTPTLAPPIATSSPISPTASLSPIPTAAVAHTSTLLPALANSSITILGNDDFVQQTRNALSLLQSKAPDAYQKIVTYVGIIGQSDRSGMWANEDPPRYEVSDQTAFYSLTWYASTIAHDATHSELYHQYLALNGAPVPDSAWIGVEVERFCNSYQMDVLERIGGTVDEVDYLAAQTGTHCDLDGDGDCDWDDYNARDW